MINLTTVISIRLNLGTINSGMSYEITYADGRTETQQHTPATQAFLESQGWIARRDLQHGKRPNAESEYRNK
jgi:hypothetical protein